MFQRREGLLTLPPEILADICEWVRVQNKEFRKAGEDGEEWDGRGVAGLFLTCKDLNEIATPFVFEVSTSSLWDPGDIAAKL